MSNSLCVEKAKKSSVQRLAFLPRFGFFLDFAGRQVAYRQAPLLEALFNMRRTGFSMKNFVDVSFRQLSEIDLPKQEKIVLPNLAVKGKSKKIAKAASKRNKKS